MERLRGQEELLDMHRDDIREGTEDSYGTLMAMETLFKASAPEAVVRL